MLSMTAKAGHYIITRDIREVAINHCASHPLCLFYLVVFFHLLPHPHPSKNLLDKKLLISNYSFLFFLLSLYNYIVTTMRVSLFQHIVSLFAPEVAHSIRMHLMRMAGILPTGRWWLKRIYAPRSKELHTEVFGLPFRNPIGVAAGYDNNGHNLNELGAMGFGFVEVGSVMPRRHPGTPRPRLKFIPSKRAFIDRTGYPSLGLEHVLDFVRKRHKHTKSLVIGCNISKMTSTHPEDITKDYLRVFRNMYQYVDFFVINIACGTSTKPFEPRTPEEIRAIIDPLFEFRRGQLDYRPECVADICACTKYIKIWG